MTTVCNPIFPKGGDPWLIQSPDGMYYYTCTMGKQLAIWKAETLETLHNSKPTAVWIPPETGPGSCDLWAPELHYLDGRWLIYYAASDGTHDAGRRMHVLICSGSDPVNDRWEHLGIINTARAGLDGTVFERNGERYFVYAGYGNFPEHGSAVYIAKMKDLCTLTGEETCLTAPEYEWERQGGMPINEGPAFLHRNGRIFLIYSASTTWSEDYSLGMLTADENADLLDASCWTKSPVPVFKKYPANRVLAPGHNSFCTTKSGVDLIVYHAIDGEGGQDRLDTSKRCPRIQRVNWNPDGTPDFGIPVPCGVEIPL